MLVQQVVDAVDLHAGAQARVLVEGQPEGGGDDLGGLAAAHQGAGDDRVDAQVEGGDAGGGVPDPVGALLGQRARLVLVPGRGPRVLGDAVTQEEEGRGHDPWSIPLPAPGRKGAG